jgi:integrase
MIRRAKNDPFGKGAAIYVGKTGADLCPVTALFNYLKIRPNVPGPLFTYPDSSPLLKTSFVSEVKKGLQAAGLDQSLYTGHSFRSGAATSAASAGVPAHLIQSAGRWSSDAYLVYIKTPIESFTELSKTLACQARC